jgi:hypothetical protein
MPPGGGREGDRQRGKFYGKKKTLDTHHRSSFNSDVPLFYLLHRTRGLEKSLLTIITTPTQAQANTRIHTHPGPGKHTHTHSHHTFVVVVVVVVAVVVWVFVYTNQTAGWLPSESRRFSFTVSPSRHTASTEVGRGTDLHNPGQKHDSGPFGGRRMAGKLQGGKTTNAPLWGRKLTLVKCHLETFWKCM